MSDFHPTQERTFVLIKPDGVKRGLIGEIISRFEKVGLKVVAISMFQPTKEQIDGHYPKDEAWIERLGQKTADTYQKYGRDVKEEFGTDDLLEIGKTVRGWLVEFMASTPLVKMVIQGLHAIDMVRKLVGNTIPAKADVGTIRGDYSVDSPILANLEKRPILNLVHASETPDEAEHEINYWFSPEEIYDYTRSVE